MVSGKVMRLFADLVPKKLRNEKNLRVIEAQAKSEGKGIWDEQPENQRTVAFQMPTDPQAFIADHKDEEIDGE